MFYDVAYAMAPPPDADVTTFDTIMNFMPLVILLLIFYFLLIRPQHKKQKELKDMVANLKEGDRIVTQGGLIGTVKKVKDSEITLEVANDVRVKINRSYVASMVTKNV